MGIGVYNLAAWGVIVSLALMLIGGLVMWAYGGKRPSVSDQLFAAVGPEAEATRLFHVKLTRWFFVYGAVVIFIGSCLFLWSSSILF